MSQSTEGDGEAGGNLSIAGSGIDEAKPSQLSVSGRGVRRSYKVRRSN